MASKRRSYQWKARTDFPSVLTGAVLAVLVGTIITSMVHESGHAFWVLVFNGHVTQWVFSWFWGVTAFSGNFAQWQLFIIYSGGTMFVSLLMLLLAFLPEPFFTNIASIIFGFRNMIDGSPFAAGTDGYQMAQISLIGAWVWYGFLFLLWVYALAHISGVEFHWKKSRMGI